jgi:uncharacterized protein YlzI (FlbEa/FlbD family)
MREVVFAGADGDPVRVRPDWIESTSLTADGVVLRFVNGVTALVKEPYLRVLERLAGL